MTQSGVASTARGASRTGHPTAVAEYDDMVAARAAIEHLEDQGIDGDDIVMLDVGVEEDQVPDRMAADSAIGKYTSLWVAFGAVAGAVVGTVIGTIVIGLLVLLWPSGLGHPWWAWGLGTGYVAAAGSVVGGFVALARKSSFSDSWPITFEPHDIPGSPDSLDDSPETRHPSPDRPVCVRVAVYGNSDRAESALEKTAPRKIEADPDLFTVPSGPR